MVFVRCKIKKALEKYCQKNHYTTSLIDLTNWWVLYLFLQTSTVTEAWLQCKSKTSQGFQTFLTGINNSITVQIRSLHIVK